jgi:hypothetical protein
VCCAAVTAHQCNVSCPRQAAQFASLQNRFAGSVLVHTRLTALRTFVGWVGADCLGQQVLLFESRQQNNLIRLPPLCKREQQRTLARP